MAGAPYLFAQPIQQAFTGGELTPLLSARPDQARYQTGCRKLRNMVCIPQGAATRRPGFRFLGKTKDQPTTERPTGGVRIDSFVYSVEQTRILEFGHLYMRIWRGDLLLSKPTDVTTPYEIVTPYTADDIESLLIHQIADVVYITHPKHRPMKISRYGDTDWRVAELVFMPTIQPPATIGVEYKQTATPPAGTRPQIYVVTTIAEADGEESLPSTSATVTTPPLTDQNCVRVTWAAVSGAQEYRVYKKQSGVFGFVGRVQASDPDQYFDDYNILPDMADPPPGAKDPFVGEGNYPSRCFSWQQRLGFGRTVKKPLTVWMSPIGIFESMAASVPPGDEDALEFTVSGDQQYRIQWIAGDKSLLIGSEANIKAVNKSSDNQAITPSNINLTIEQHEGAADVPPVAAGSAVIMVHASGRAVHEVQYSFTDDGYKSPDLSLLAEHIFLDRTIKRMAWQKSPWSILYCLLDNGTLASCTYLREHDVVGWHVQSTDGFIEDICTVPGLGESSLYVVVRRTNSHGTFRSIERLAPFFRSSEPTNAFFVDSGLTYRGEPKTVFDGLDHLEGRTVQILADGYESPAQVVTGGAITLPVAARVVHVGLPYVSEITPSQPEIPMQQGSTLSRMRQVTGAVLRLYQSMSVLAGADDAHMYTVVTHNAANPINPAFVTGDFKVVMDSGWIASGGLWKDDAYVTVRSAGPTPMTLLSIVYNMQIAAGTGVPS